MLRYQITKQIHTHNLISLVSFKLTPVFRLAGALFLPLERLPRPVLVVLVSSGLGVRGGDIFSWVWVMAAKAPKLSGVGETCWDRLDRF